MSVSTALKSMVCSISAGLAAWLALSSPSAIAQSRSTELAERAKAIFTARCFSCHGQNGIAKKNVFVLDRERLIASSAVNPGDPNSPLLRLVEADEMPLGGPPLAPDDKAALQAWVAAGAPAWNIAPRSPAHRFQSDREILNRIRDDLISSSERDRPYLRYFSIAHLRNAGAGEADLESHRVALARLVNSLSWHRELTPPTAVDETGTLLRIDLRDYNWTAGSWNSILAHYPYGVRSTDSEVISRITGLVVPYIRADWFLARASLPPLYHEVLALPGNVRELERILGVDAARDIAEEKNVARAGIRASGVSRNNRVLERHVSPYGAYWKSFDFRNNLDSQNIFKDPLRLNPAGGEIIFNLPNGLQAYFLIDATGRRIDEAPIAIVADRNNLDDPVIRNGRSCMSCHFEGIQAFKDDVRPVVEGLAFSQFDREKALALYPAQDAIDKLVVRDRERFTQAAQQLGPLPVGAQTEPINALSRRFLSHLTVAQAAAEAGLETKDFQSRVARSQRLLALGYGQLLVAEGGIKRDAWDRNFGDLVRELQLGNHVTSLIILARGAAPAVSVAGTSDRSGARFSPVSADPASIMRTARTIVIRSKTIYLSVEQLEAELRKRPEFRLMELAIVKDERMADIRIEINRGALSFDYAYTATNPQSSVVVASGKFTAWNGGFAAPRIARDFLKQMQAVRGSSREAQR